MLHVLLLQRQDTSAFQRAQLLGVLSAVLMCSTRHSPLAMSWDAYKVRTATTSMQACSHVSHCAAHVLEASLV